eukprot:5430226-Pleurochrysis_carterae.AAC.4
MSTICYARQCAKPPFKGPRWTKSDPIVFHNRAGLPMDMFFWNGAEAGLPLYRIAPSINDACYFQRLAESGPLHIMRSVLADTIEDHACLISTGTCEELISWNDVGGLQPLQHKAVESTQGHTFRFRDAATRRLLMQHTLSDLVLRGCDDGSAEKNAESVESLRKTVSELEDEVRRPRGLAVEA